jgi:Copper transport outer membrane protein, MctB
VIRRVRGELFSRFSGRAARVDDVILARDASEELEEREAEATDALEDGMLEGIRHTQLPMVAVERTDTEESSIELFGSHDIPTVDDVDLVAGRVAMVFVLLGADGNFGVKDSADELLPDLLRRSAEPGGG